MLQTGLKPLLPLLAALLAGCAVSAWAGWTFSLTTQAHDHYSVWQDGYAVELGDGITVNELTPTEARILAQALLAAADGKLKPEGK